MEATNYIYKGKSWRPSSTIPDHNSFFHAAFGTNESGVFFDKHIKCRRMRWAAFVSYFENEEMPSCLADILKNCFSANERYKKASIHNKRDLAEYDSGIMTDEQAVTMEEVSILSALENTTVVVLSGEDVTIFKPNPKIFGTYPKEVAKGKCKEVLLCLKGNIFERLETVREEPCPKCTKNKTEKKLNCNKYKKVGSAGSKGVQYQVNMLTIVILNSIRTDGWSGWKLSTENEEAGKFDDIVFECAGQAILVQSKFKEDNSKKVTLKELTSTNCKNDDFSLAKYFLSYMSIQNKFNIKNVILCSNADVDEENWNFMNLKKANNDSLLHYLDGKCQFYTVSDAIVPILKVKTMEYYQNCANRDVHESIITEENLTEFLSKFQLYFNYPSVKGLIRHTEHLLSLTEHCTNSQGHIMQKELYCKVMDWFQQKDGVYITKIHAKAMFAEVWSDKYCQKLKRYKLQKNELNFQGTKQVYHVTSPHGNLLSAIKVYYAVQNARTLFVDVDDDIEIQKLILEAFALPQYMFLVINQLKVVEESVIMGMCAKLRNILSEKHYKKVILITRYDTFFRYIGRDYEVIDKIATIAELSKSSQDKLLKKKVIEFQGKLVCLEELLAGQTVDCVNSVDSEILENIIAGEVKVGVQLLDIAKDNSLFYINRTFKRSRDIIYEDNIYNTNENVVLISNCAGMGKTTVLSKLSTKIKETNPYLWVIKIALTEYTHVLRELKNSGKPITVAKLLDSKIETKLTNPLERFVFSLEKKVVLMFDGIDEISPDYTPLVLDMLTQCLRETNVAKLFITTRSHMVPELSKILNVKPFELQPYTEKNQIDFLAGYWANNLVVGNKKRCEQYATALIHKMSSWTGGHHYDEDEFTAIALQLRMLAEIFKETIQLNEYSDWEGCREYLMKTSTVPKFPEKIEMKKLYDMFIEAKKHVYIEKGNPSGSIEANIALRKQFDESLSCHKSLALEVIGNVRDRRLFSCRRENCEDVDESILKIGIVQKPNERFYFIHRTFAEYFFAEALADELQLQSEKPNVYFQEFFFHSVLRLPQYRIIRAFLNNFLQKVELPHPRDVFKTYQSRNINFFTMKYDYLVINLLVREGYVNILQLILNYLGFETIKENTSFPSLLTDISFADDYSLPRVLKDFMRRENMPVNMLNVSKILLQDMRLEFRNVEGRTPLLVATRKGHFEMVKFLVDQGAKLDSTDISELTALHLAAGIGRADIVKYLVERGLEINLRNANGYTPLHFAAVRGDLDCVAYLLDSSADVTLRNNRGCSALHFAAMGSPLDAIKFLFSLTGGYPRKTDTTPSQPDLIELLVEHSGEVNVKDKDGCTPLHFAAMFGHLDTIKHLRGLGGDLSIRNIDGKTALQLANEYGRLENVSAEQLMLFLE